MKNKILIYFAILFIALLAISSVSASEIDNDINLINEENDDLALDAGDNDIGSISVDAGKSDNDYLESSDVQLDDNRDNTEINNNENGDNLKSSSNSNILTEDNPEGTFTDLANEIGDADEELNLTRNYTFVDEIDSSYKDGILIEKNMIINGNGVTINGNNLARLFRISSNDTILKNISFMNCFSNQSGGALYWYGNNCTLYDCSFVNCFSNQSGGAVYSDRYIGTIFNCSFVNCSSNGDGGAILRSSVYNSSFVNCSSRNRGGAISACVIVFNCDFMNCSASSYGGSIYSSHSTTLQNCTFNNGFLSSIKQCYGTAICIQSFRGIINNCSFFNYSEISNVTSEGVVCFYSSEGSVLNNSFFVNCSASYGAVNWYGETGTLNNCTFLNCPRSFYGAIYWYSSDNGKIKDCRFWNCSSDIYMIYSNNLSIDNCNFSNSNNLNGCLIEVMNSSDCALLNCNFMNCSYIPASSSVIIRSRGTINISSCNFTNCGAVLSISGYGEVYSCSFVNCSINFPTSHLISLSGAKGSLVDCSFVNCSSNQSGGAVFWSGVNGTIDNCSFVDCSSNQSGGAVFWSGVNGTIDNCSFVNCSGVFGGAIYLSGENTVINKSLFEGNHAIYADSVYIYNQSISEDEINSNNFIYDENPFRMDIYLFFENLNDGCTIDLDKDYEILVNNPISVPNHNVIINGNGHILNANGTDINALFSITGKNVTLKNFIFSNLNLPENVSYSYKYFYWNGANGSMINCSLINCSAPKGYIISWGGANGSMINCSLINCSSRNSYIISWDGANGTMFNCSLVDSFTTYYQLIRCGVNGSVFNCSFINCSNKVIYFYGDGCVIDNSSFNNMTLNYTNYVISNKKIKQSFSSNISDILLDDSMIFIVNLNMGLSIDTTIKVYNISKNSILLENFTISNNNNVFELNLSYLTAGNYRVEVVNPGDSLFNSLSKNITFSVLKTNSSILIYENEAIAGDDLNITIDLNDDASGTVFMSLNNSTYYSHVINGKATIIIPYIIGGTLNYTINYTGDEKYYPIILNKSIVIPFKESFVNFHVNDTNFTQAIPLIPITPNDATGIISIFINNEFRDNISLGQTYSLSGLNAGEYDLTLRYNGDNYYSSSENTVTFRINKINPNISVDISDLRAGDVDIHVSFETESSGNISVIIDNRVHTKEFINSTIITIPNLKAGTYDYTIIYSGNQNLNPINETHSMVLELRESEINMNLSNITEDDLLNITFNVNGVDSGIISLFLNNTFLRNVSASENVSIPNLRIGKYILTAIYNGDEYCLSSNDTKEFTVFAKSFINIELNDVNYGESIILSPVVTSNAVGSIKIYVDNIYQTEISVGETYNLSGLNAGNHIVKVIYSGDDYFASSENVTNFSVNKIDTVISAFARNLTAGRTIILVSLNKNATGNITFNINNQNYTKALSKGNATYYIYDLPAGEYNFTIFYEGDINFNPNSRVGNLTIQIKPSNISINAEDSYVDSLAIIEYNLTSGASGNLSIYLNNTFIKNVTVGKNIELDDLEAGNYTVKVVYNSDGYYASCEDTSTFEVNKLDPTIDLIVSSFKAGDNANLIFMINEDAHGNIIVNGSVLNIVEGRAIFNVPNIKGGMNVFRLIYSGDRKFNPFSSDYSVFVSFKQTDIDFIANNILWGDNMTVAPTLAEDATGIIDIYVDDIYNTTIDVGESIGIPFYMGGYHNITVIYRGDEYYAQNNVTKTFNVIKLNSTATLEGNIEPDNSGTIYLTLNEDATGIVHITLKNNYYTSTLENGVARFTVPNLTAGNYSVFVTYNGDTKYASISKYINLEVSLKKAIIGLNLKNIKYGSSILIKPTITEGARGTFYVYINDNLKKTMTVGNNYTFTQPDIGKYEVRVAYSGDSYHEACENVTSFWVYSQYPIEFKNINIIENTGKHLQAVFYDEYYQPLNNKYVAFNFNGTDYVALTNEEGLATFNLDLGFGKYNVTAINTILNEEKTVELNVFTSIISQNMTRAYNTGIDYAVQLLGNDGKPLINGFAIFEVNGNNHTIRTNNNGMAILNIILDVGTYSIFTINTETLENKTNTITIVPSIYAKDMVKTYNSGIDFQAKFLDEYVSDLNNAEISFTLKGVIRNDEGVFYVNSTEYNLTTDGNGIATLNAKIGVGEYDVIIYNKITGETATRNLIILDRITGNDDYIEVLGTNEYFVVRVLDDYGEAVGAGELVNVTFDGVSYLVFTDDTGHASFKIDENYGYHQISFEYKGYKTFNELYLLEDIGELMEIDVDNISYNQNLYPNIRLDSYNPDAYVLITIDSDNGILKVYNRSAYNPIELFVSKLDAGNYSIMAEYFDLQNFEYSFASENFEVSKIDPTLVLVVENATVGENATITVNIQQISGYITIKVGNERIFNEFIPEDGVIIKKINDLPIGEYPVEITYNGNENYNVLTKTASLNISRIPSNLYVDAHNVYYGEDINVTILSNVAGNVKVKIGTALQSIDVLANKEYNLFFKNLDAKTYNLVANLTPDDSSYDEFIFYGTVVVNPANPNLVLYANDIEIGQATNITAVLRDDVTGVVKFELNNVNRTVNIIGGKAVLDIGGLGLGHYTVKAFFDGNNNFNSDEGSAVFDVTKVETIDIIDIPDTMDDIDNNFVISLPSDAGGNITVLIDGKISSADVINGKANITLPDLVNGNYEYTITYSGDDKYSSFSKDGILTIDKVFITVKARDMTVTYGGDYEFYATFYQNNGSLLVGTTVLFTVNGIDYTNKTDSQGIAYLKVGLSPGNYTITSTNIRTDESVTNKLIVLDNRAPIDDKDIVIPPLDNPSADGSVKILLPSDATGNIILNIGGTNYDFPVVNGVATVKMPNLADGSYSYTITYSGDSKYSSFVKSGNVNIKKQISTNIVAPAISTVYNGGKYLVATLKDSKGNILKNKKLTINLNGKTSTLTTNAYGQVKLLVNLVPKAYTALISFAGDSTYMKSSASVKVTVNKAKPKIIAKKKTFKLKLKVKKYKITLKTNKGKVMKNIKVTLKVKGKKYKVKTNKKGVATFKIKNLKKKGTYKATVAYAGNKYYKKVSKKVKIKVK